MSTVNPRSHEYETPDGLKVAKDISWVIKTLWGGAVVFVLATVWVVALAQDVKSNTDKIEEAATKEQVQSIATVLERLEQKIDEGDKRQRQIQQSQARLEQKVEDIEEDIKE